MDTQFRWTSGHTPIVAAWHNQLRKLSRTPWLLRTLLDQGPEVASRFTAIYRQLRALPRRTRRLLGKGWATSLASLALLLALGQGPAWALTINVTGACTLVDAITAANTDTATGGCTTGASGPDTLVLSSTHTLTTVNNSTYGDTGLPVVTSPITIAGNNNTIARDTGMSTPEFQLLTVGPTGDLTVQDTTLTGGVGQFAVFFFFGQSGGAVSNVGGVVTLSNCTITGNTGGVSNLGIAGSPFPGAETAQATLSNCMITGDSLGAVINEGVVYDSSATLTASAIMDISGSAISGNAFGVVNLGGSPFLSGGTTAPAEASITITNSTITDNTQGGV
ncbi:MAG: hypothetical protein ACRERD_32165, partial [Candidatus Binatia bacterium]